MRFSFRLSRYKRRAHLGWRGKKCGPFGFRPTHFITGRRQIHHRQATPSRQGPIGSSFNLNRDKRRWRGWREGLGLRALLYPLPKKVRIDPMFERKPRYRNARLKAGCDKQLLRCEVVSASPVPTDKSHPQFLIFFHQMVSTYLGGRLMPQPTQGQKVLGNSRLRFRQPWNIFVLDHVTYPGAGIPRSHRLRDWARACPG